MTQDNQGKRTAGIDGVKSVEPAQRFIMVQRLRHHKTIKPQPTRRVWIPKPGKAEKRPLGILTMLDRAHQCLVKLALEPEWEARFEANSYGFRPGRSVHDAIAAIFNIISKQPKYVLDADIANCFNNINHTVLLEKLHTFPAMRRVIKAWLKAGVLEEGVFTPTEAGTPQGGPLSPLLANVALHGMEQAIQAEYPWKGRDKPKPKLVRYADDLVVLFPTLEGIEKARTVLEQWLAAIGLELKPSKTRLVHTLTSLNEEPPGFNFLGFEIRQHPVGKYRSGKHNGRLLGFKTIIQRESKRPSNAIGKRYGWWSTPGRDFHKKHSLGNSTQRYADGHDTTEVSWRRKSSTTVTTISIPFSFDGPNADIRESQQAGYGCGTGAPLGKIAGALPHQRATPSPTMRQSQSSVMSR